MQAYGFLVITIITSAVRRTVARRIQTTDQTMLTNLLSTTSAPRIPKGYGLCPDCGGSPVHFCERCLGEGILPLSRIDNLILNEVA